MKHWTDVLKNIRVPKLLCLATVYCKECQKRQALDKIIPNIDYCMCRGRLNYADRTRQFDSWEAFLERENILVWRRRHEKHPHLYSYKVYGTYDDMSLSAFMEVQLNPSFRSEWDSSALQLKIINSHSSTNSDLMYWLVKFPQFFANRDYVFKRRYKVNEERKEVVIMNEIEEDCNLSEQNGVHRVKEYWSIMVLRAKENFNKPGMSYTLTYFDNPGTSLPSAVTNFIASTAFPDFLRKVHRAAMSLQRRWENGENVYVSLPARLRGSRCFEQDSFSSVLGDTIPIDSSNDNGTKLSQLHVIKEALQDSKNDDSNLESNAKPNYKIPLKFKKAVIDLLEAIEVISPELDEKSVLSTKIEALIDKLGLDASRKSQLVKRLEALRSKTKSFMDDAARKKEESIKIMNEFEKRKYYYDQTATDERTLLLIHGLLKNINDVLKADKDMRTGRSFHITEETKSPTTEPPTGEADNTPDLDSNSDSLKETDWDSNSDSLKEKPASCNCTCNTSLENEAPPSRWNYLNLYSWWRSDKPNPGLTVPCSCHGSEGKEGPAGSKPVSECSPENANESHEGSASSSWFNFFAGSSSATCSNHEPSGGKTEMEDKGENSNSWINFSWIFRIWTGATV
ncbi:UNVERIFIED_CONTAM: hypothetical protein GTU68_022261 [Idotea baltica]|nr:hypothetical protein [Idotea baltica]